jgi:beta-glucosidase
LALPGDQNALISAVAAANPRTIVVINSGGAVLMPWISKVAAVLEAWYPGQEDGEALAPVLFGSVDPSGRLPITFPVSDSQTSTSTALMWPGVDDTVSFQNGLDIGYRGYEAANLPVLFSFGSGLSYTQFSLSDLKLSRSGNGEIATVKLKNTGTFRGTDIVQAYLSFPKSAMEPSRQLVAFDRIYLSSGSSATVSLHVPHTAFQAFLGDSWAAASSKSWRVSPGSYELFVGESSNDLPLHATLSAP